jgi:23S rRNA (pseudouridine1915-N3)-methyltransferase
MRIIVAAVGRLKQGPERDLAKRYREHAVKAGRPVGIRDVEIVEVAESRARDAPRRRIEESIALAQLTPDGAAKVVLDQGGENVDSPTFAGFLRRLRDQGCPAAVFIIGGPDGITANLRGAADLRIAFGAATWPHQLARIMLLEQLYRAVTILAGHPYHRAERP